MFKPGNSFADYLFIAITFLPLLPAALLLFQKSLGRDPLHLLLIICLLDFIRDLPMHLSMLSEDNQSVINNVCYPIELTLLALLFRPTLVKPLRDGLTITLIAFLSSLVTWLTIKGWESNGLYLQIIQNVMVIGLILLSLPLLVRSKGLDIFRSPLFWIAGGTLFQLLIILLLNLINPCCGSNAEDKIFLSIAALIRYSLYTLAVLPGRDTIQVE
jgi:hypothetical protein